MALNPSARLSKLILNLITLFQISGFLDKNRDTVMEEQLNILRASNNELLSDLFLDQGTKRERSHRLRVSTFANLRSCHPKKVIKLFSNLIQDDFFCELPSQSKTKKTSASGPGAGGKKQNKKTVRFIQLLGGSTGFIPLLGKNLLSHL